MSSHSESDSVTLHSLHSTRDADCGAVTFLVGSGSSSGSGSGKHPGSGSDSGSE